MQKSHPYIKNELLAEILKPKRIVFIVNPKAGTNVQRHIRSSVENRLDHKKFVYGIWHTEKAGHAADLVQKAKDEQYDIVVAVGGDGSVNEVASQLIGTDIALGILPAGSGNGLAMHLGYGRDLDKAVQKLNSAQIQRIDCGLLNGRPFFNVAGIGFDGLVSNMMKETNKRGFLPYLLKSVEAGLTYTARHCRIETEDRLFEGKFFAIAIANGPMYGYNFQIAPDARLDDGLFSVVLLKDAPRWQYFAAVPATLNGKIYDADFVEHLTAKSVVITSPGKNYVHIDGEGLIIEDELHFEVKPGALNILAPTV
jgi:YegS/Rv2252/BmrU family lipid kinase